MREAPKNSLGLQSVRSLHINKLETWRNSQMKLKNDSWNINGRNRNGARDTHDGRGTSKFQDRGGKWTTWQKLKMFCWWTLAWYIAGGLTGGIVFQRLTGNELDQARVKYLDMIGDLKRSAANQPLTFRSPEESAESYLPGPQCEKQTEPPDAESESSIVEIASNLVDKVTDLIGQSPTIINQVDSSFDVTTEHIVTEDSLNQCLGGVLEGKGAVFLEACEKYRVSPAFIAAIAMHESGNGTSRYAREYNNVAGILTGSKPRKFASVDDCINFTAKLIGTYPPYVKKGKKTVGEIQTVYCPVGAKNDPRGLNKHWTTGVVNSMNRILHKNEILLAQNQNIE